MLKEFSVGGVSSIRDLAWDEVEQLMCGGAAAGSIYCWDPISETLDNTISGGFQARASAYNSEDEYFYVSNWGDPCWVVDKTGGIVDQFDFSLTTSTYGLAYDKWSEDGPFLWVFDQGGSGAEIKQWDLDGGEFTGVEHDVTSDYPSYSLIAGGLCLTEAHTPGFAYLGGCGQGSPDTMFMYDIDAITEKPEHDLGIKKILKPETGYAYPDMEMQVEVANYGKHQETTDVQMNIIRCEGTGDYFVNENFSGATFPPANWTTDYWRKAYTNNAGALSPEANCYYYTQRGYPYYDYYDNYIQGPAVNATGWEKVNLRFAFAADIYTANYCYLYLKYRKNSTSNWVDVTPWENPIASDFQDWFEIGCYGFGDDIGDEFQFKWEYLGYYSYFRNWWLDDVTLEGCGGCAEYSAITEDVTIDVDETIVVDLPAWTPTNWQNETDEDSWIEYPVQAIVLLDDNYSRNNEKWKLFDLYFPWLHDIASMDVAGPATGPAQTFDVVGNIKNIGQNDECCFKTYLTIAEIDYDNPIALFFDTQQGYYYSAPSGWDKGASNYYAWYWYPYYSYINLPGVTAPNARCYWYYSAGAELISPAVDTTAAGALDLEFAMYYDHFYNDYELYVGVRANPGEFWAEIQPWDNPVTGNMGPDFYTVDATIGIGTETQMRFWTGGYYYNMDYWYLDNMKFTGYDVKEPEHEEQFCTTEIAPNEEQELDFGEWTPAFLAEETSGQKTYLIRQKTELEDPPDRNTANDIYQYAAILDFFHDVGVKEVSSPKTIHDDVFYATNAGTNQLVWFDPANPGVFNTYGTFPSTQFPQGATFYDGDLYVCDTTGSIWIIDIGTGGSTYVGSAGTGELVAIESQGKDMWGISTKNFYEIDPGTGSATYIGAMGNPSLMIGMGADNDGVYVYELSFSGSPLFEVDTSTGALTLIGSTGIVTNFGQDMSMDKAEGQLWMAAFNYNTWSGELWMIDRETAAGTYIGTFPGGTQTTCLAIPGGGGVGVDVYVQPGNQDIDVVVENLGTFPELDLICYAEIQEFITNCTNGTVVYNDNITNIDLTVPLGGTELLNFNNYNFAMEGLYGVFISLPDEDDDDLGNNEMVWGVGVDATPPISSHSVDPADPDGDNGWYVNDVEVTLAALDPSIGCEIAGSGVNRIEYRIGGGSWQTMGPEGGTFVVDVDEDDLLIEYRAVDNVENVESTNSFNIDMDQTVPDIEAVTWESYQEDGAWWVKFTCNAVDETSLMDRVEMFIHDGHHETIEGIGPIYEFVVEYSTIFKTITFHFYHYDTAGNVIEDTIDGADITAYPVAQEQQQHSNTIIQTA
jgi:hypothetical protein